MWWDHELPLFCPVHHLLAWVRLSSIRDGFLFPSYIFLMGNIIKNWSSFDGNVTQEIPYHDVLATWKNLCWKLLERDGRWGAHSGQKTSYLFGVWGGAQDSELMTCAWHKTLIHAMTYKKDSKFLLSIAKQNSDDLIQMTPQWKSCFCDQHQLAMAFNAASRFVDASFSTFLLWMSLSNILRIVTFVSRPFFKPFMS
jgi:hypothetical protein